MTSHLEDEAIIPAVSTLLGGGGTLPTSPIRTYSRERMMELRTTKASMTRPEKLSEDYNGEDGKFSPLKWLEHRWEVEGIKNRPMSKKIDSLCAGADENTGLSPQRRAFSSGCKAPTDDKARDGEYERLGGQGKNWRNGSTGGADKFAQRGNDFKPSFQKGGQLDRGAVRSTDWKKEATRGTKFTSRREDRMNSMSGSEKLPEWADGPTTMDDMIELRGFDEPKKGKSKKAPKEKKEKETKQSEASECAASQPSSTGTKTVEPIDDPAIAYSSVGGALPATDQELAALLGCLDTQKSSRKVDGEDVVYSHKGEGSAGGTSRLSRFFGKKSKSPELEAMLASVGGGNEENIANPMLAKLFNHSGGDTNASSSGLGDMKGGMRLEDLEKGIDTKEPSKGSPLQDPSQQAQLMHHLQKVAKQQSEAALQMQNQRQPTPPNGGSHHQQQMHHSFHQQQQMPIIADPALLANFAQNPLVLNAYVENQLQEAINAAIRANNGQQIPTQLHEQLRMASMRNKAFLQSQTLAFVTLQQQHQNLQHHHQQHQQHQQQKGRTPAMIPASVQRQLHKSSSNADQKKEKSSQSPPESTQEATDAQLQSDAANQLKKIQMQQNYANMVQAMNSGVGWPRGNAAGNGQQQPLPHNVQMLMAQHQQAQMQHLKMMYTRAQQQQLLMAKLAHMQQHQAQAQMASMQERQGSSSNHHQQQQQQPKSVPSELSQVGPIQTPLEKLLASVGVQGSQFTGSGDRIPSSARPMSLEDLEKQLTAGQK